MRLSSARHKTSNGLMLAVALVLAAGCSKPGPQSQATIPDPAAARVLVQKVENRTQQTTEEVLGTVRAKFRATLEARLNGRISQMPVLLGQTVKAGQLLAHLDALEIKARLEVAQAAWEQADREWKRLSALFAGKTVTLSEYEAAQSRERIAKATLAEAQVMMNYVDVTAPFDGVITKKWVDVGDLAVPGKPLLNVEDPSALQAEADVPESIGSTLQPGSHLTVRVDTLRGDLTSTVAEITPSADPASRTFRVKLDLSQTPGLRSGQFARLFVPTGESTALRVPLSAIVQRGQLEIAFVVLNQRAQMHLVKTGKRIGQEVEILSGLDEGELVVIDGAPPLSDGQPVILP